MNNTLTTTLQAGYPSGLQSVLLGSAKDGDSILPDCKISLPLASLNRHGLIAGATGTGKTKTVQLLAEQLASHGVPSLLMDLKGDLSGIAIAGATNSKLEHRLKISQQHWTAQGFTTEFLSLSEQPGLPLRGTITEFGPILLAKMLDLNDTQAGVVAIIFKYCSDEKIPLVDLSDLNHLLKHFAGDSRKALQQQYGYFSSASVGSLQRKVLELEQQGAARFFGEPSFAVADLCRTDTNGKGIISLLRLQDIQSKPKLFATFMLGLLTEIYESFPEVGDSEKPKLVVVIDEAHLLFKQASPALLEKIESIVRLIRSKSVGIFFCTQSPKDLPDAILGQLGTKIQHAMRAFTAKDRKAIKAIAENYPLTEYYDVAQLLTSLGTGEAVVTTLAKSGQPTPLAAVFLDAPQSRMGPLSTDELSAVVSQSTIYDKYITRLKRDTASEKLSQRLRTTSKPEKSTRRLKKESDSMLSSLSKNTMVRQMGRTLMRELVRSISKLLK